MSLGAIRVLLGHHWRLHRRPLVPMALALVLFEFLFSQIAPTKDETSWVTGMIALLPPALRGLGGDDMAMASTGGFLALGYVHPFFLLLLAVWAVRVSSAALAGEMGRGTMDLLGARPIARADLVAAGSVAIALGLAALTLSAWLGTVVGLQTRALDITPWPVGRAAVTVWVLYLAWGAVGLVASALQREAGPAITWTAAVMAVSFVLDYLARLWTPITALRPWSLFAHYLPTDLVRGGWSMSALVIFAGVWLVSTAIALAIFQRRDL